MTDFASFDLAGFEQARPDDRRAKARDIDHICRETGFLVLHNHGVPDVVIDDIWQAALRFFALRGKVWHSFTSQTGRHRSPRWMVRPVRRRSGPGPI